MRHFLLSAGLALLVVALPMPGFAQAADDCGMLCGLSHYLSSDHMAGDPVVEGSPAASPKARRAHRAAAKAPPAPANPAMAKAGSRAAKAHVAESRVDPAPAAQRPTAPVVAVQRAAAVPQAKPKAKVTVTAAKPLEAPARQRVAARSTPARVTPARVTAAAPVAPEHQPAPVVTQAQPARAPRVVAAKPRPAPHMLTAAALIPGSAPALAAGFH